MTAVCENAAPTREEPVSMTMLVAHRMMPCISDVVFKVVAPAICQKMFSAFAPPTRVTIAPEPTVRSPEICRIHTASASDSPEALVPLNVRDEVKPTLSRPERSRKDTCGKLRGNDRGEAMPKFDTVKAE